MLTKRPQAVAGTFTPGRSGSGVNVFESAGAWITGTV